MKIREEPCDGWKNLAKYIRPSLAEKFEFQSYGHALEILSEAFPTEWKEIQDCLENLSISVADIRAAGGNETAIPKKFDDFLYPVGWREIKITGDLLVKLFPRRENQRGRFSNMPYEERIISGYIDGHNIDFIKNKGYLGVLEKFTVIMTIPLLIIVYKAVKSRKKIGRAHV